MSMLRPALRLLAGLGLALVLAAPAAADLIETGSFEDPSLAGNWSSFDSSQVDGWDSSSRIEIQGSSLFGPAASGNQYVELDSNRGDGNSYILQTLETVAGEHYTLSFAFSARPGHYDNAVEVVIGGANDFNIYSGIVASASGTGQSQTDWHYYSIDFVATGTQTQIGFRDAGADDSLGSLLDDVTVTGTGGGSGAVPEPGSLILLASGLGGLTAWRARRTRRRKKT